MDAIWPFEQDHFQNRQTDGWTDRITAPQDRASITASGGKNHYNIKKQIHKDILDPIDWAINTRGLIIISKSCCKWRVRDVSDTSAGKSNTGIHCRVEDWISILFANYGSTGLIRC